MDTLNNKLRDAIDDFFASAKLTQQQAEQVWRARADLEAAAEIMLTEPKTAQHKAAGAFAVLGSIAVIHGLEGEERLRVIFETTLTEFLKFIIAVA